MKITLIYTADERISRSSMDLECVATNDLSVRLLVGKILAREGIDGKAAEKAIEECMENGQTYTDLKDRDGNVFRVVTEKMTADQIL